MPLPEKYRSYAADFLLFKIIHGGSRTATAHSAPRLHLNKNHCVAITRDDIYLPQHHTIVAGHDAIARALEILRRCLFARVADDLVVHAARSSDG